MEMPSPYVEALGASLRRLLEAAEAIVGVPEELARARTSAATSREVDMLDALVNRVESLSPEVTYTARDIIDLLPEPRRQTSAIVASWNREFGPQPS